MSEAGEWERYHGFEHDEETLTDLVFDMMRSDRQMLDDEQEQWWAEQDKDNEWIKAMGEDHGATK